MATRTARGEEAAAVAAAIARFEAEFGGGASTEPEPRTSAWQRAALLEGVSATRTIQEESGGAKWLS